jgi:D-3-phosphoglycerate dehydrogenase
MYKVRTYNKISVKGLDRFPRQSYEVGSDIAHPDAFLLRSQKLQGIDVPASLLAVARAGAGVNNVPVAEYGKQGIVVFNTPGANANAVKELVMAGMLLSARGIVDGMNYVQSLADMKDPAEMSALASRRPNPALPATRSVARRSASSVWERSARWSPTWRWPWA